MIYLLLTVTEFIGRFHPVLVHLPIGVLLLALVLQWLSVYPKFAVSSTVLKLVWVIGVAGAVLSCITGYLLSLDADYEAGAVNLHMWLGISVALFSLLFLLLLRRGFSSLGKASCIVLFILITITGHFGGVLTHGSDYLTSDLITADAASEEIEMKPIANIQEALVYNDVIEPMFRSRCYSCHSSKKQKGKLRLDKPEYINKGGKSGAAVVNGDADASELVKRLLLPPEDEDHMPPRQKPQLKESEINLIHWWIDNGCSYDKKVKELTQPEKLRTLLTSLQTRTADDRKSVPLFPEKPVEAANPQALLALKEKGVVVMPVQPGSNYLTANFVTADSFGDADMHLLVPLKKQLVSLKAGSTLISDEGLKTIGSFSNLAFLQLNDTPISDSGMVFLKDLVALQSLNLVNTKISYQGLKDLEPLKQLRNIYLYQTNVKASDYLQLKKILPETRIDTGGYILPFLASDTTVLKKPLRSN